MSSNISQAISDPAVSRNQKTHWKIPLSILVLGVVAQSFFWWLWTDDLTHQVFSAYFVWPTMVFLLLLWWSFFSGLPRRTRGYGLIYAASATALFFVLIRVTFDGAMIPQLSWRWWGNADPDWADGETGARSDQSFEMQNRVEQETQKLQAIQKSLSDKKSAIQLKTAEFTSAEFLRVHGEINWNRWESVDGLAMATGCLVPAMFQKIDTTIKSPNWPHFRGPNRNATVPNAKIRTNFSPDNPPENLWPKKKRVGGGWSSFAVVEGMAFTMEQRGDKETTVCYDFANGSQIWSKSDNAHFKNALGGNGPRGTPTVFGRQLYTLGATGILNCRDALTRNLHWTHNVLEDAGADNLEWALSGSPLVAGNLVFVNAGKGNGKAVIAYHRITGEIIWATGNEPASYSTPVLAKIHNTDQLLIYNGEGLFAYDPNTGKELWKYDNWTNQPKVNATQPIVQGNDVFITSGYSSGSALLKVEIKNGQWSVSEKWVKKNRFRLKFNDGILKNGYVYGLDETILSCIDLKTGERQWRMRGKFGYGQMLLAGDVLIITSESGNVHFIPATPEKPKELGKFQGLNRDIGLLNRKGIGWNHAVLVNGKLLIRNDREVACYDLSR